MTTFPNDLHLDQNEVPTSSLHGDLGDGTTNWFHYIRLLDGGDVAQGDRSDAAAPTGDGTVIALLKAIRDLGSGAVASLTTPSVAGTSATSAPTNSASTAYVASQVIKATAGTLFGVTGFNSRTSGQFIQLYDAATLPANGVAPALIVCWVAASSSFAIDFGVFGRRFTTGIVIGNSSTGPTKTIGSADCWFDAQYK